MQVKANTSQNQTPQKTNPQNLQIQQPQPQNINIQQAIEEVIKKYIQNLQLNPQYQQPQPQQNNLNQEFIVKTTMKSSYIALRIENLLLGGKKKIVMSGLGYAIPVLVDSVLLIRKDLGRKGINVNIENIELFEKTVETNGKNKMISGIRITLSV